MTRAWLRALVVAGCGLAGAACVDRGDRGGPVAPQPPAPDVRWWGLAAGCDGCPRGGRWQPLEVGRDGSILSTAIDASVDDLGSTGDDTWEPAELAGRRGPRLTASRDRPSPG